MKSSLATFCPPCRAGVRPFCPAFPVPFIVFIEVELASDCEGRRTYEC